MGNPKLCLLLLLIQLTLTYAQDEQSSCLLNKRYKVDNKYEYLYEAESLNAIKGTSQLKNGPKATCKVEIEVPQTCSFIIRTTSCSLSEVVDMDAEGNPVFGSTSASDSFTAEMERYPLKVVVEGVYDVKLYPEDGETVSILNIKRGIISALAVPLMEEDKNKYMPTIHGMCKTKWVVNAREDIATDISLTRDLSKCDKFVPIRDHTSPLALISGMHYPLSKLIRSSHTCNYKFDNEENHMTSGSCTENHILVPFSHKGEYGVTNIGRQDLTFIQVSPVSEKVFFHGDVAKGLHMETVEDKNVVQDKDAALNLLRELATLPETEGERRAHLFYTLVSMVRGMKTETLSPAIPEALEVSRVLTYQVLAQCGTPQCSSAIMQILRTFDRPNLEVDASVIALGLVSNPSELLINDMLEMAKFKPSKPIMYALSNVVKRFYKAEGKLVPEIFSVAEFMAGKLGDCSGDSDETFMTLRVIGNMAPALVNAGPALRGAVMQCVNQPAASPAVQQAAIQVFRLIPATEEVREVFMQVLLDTASPTQKRIAAYLVLMKDPQPSELSQLASALPTEEDTQVKSFIISHLNNILSSTVPETQELRQKILDALQGNEVGTSMDPTKFSRNYKIGSLEGNMIFESSSYLPKEVMLDMTLKAFGFDIEMMEIGMEGKGFEPTVDALFGENGFFPDTSLKTMYFFSENMPQSVSKIMENIMPTLKNNRMKRQAPMNFVRDIGRNLNKLVRELKNTESPEAMVYMKLLGNELGYLNTNEMEEMAFSILRTIDSIFNMFPNDVMKALMTQTDNSIFAHYIFMDNEFFLPTMTGVPLRVALSGTFTPGIKGGLQLASDMSKVSFMPSAGVEFVTRLGSHFPEYVNSGLEMHTNMFHESGLKAEITLARDNLKLTMPSPTAPTKLVKMTNTLVAVTGSEVKTIPPMVMDKVDVSECTPVFAGMKYCTSLQYTDAFNQETAPYFPFTGNSKFVMELHPTGEVTEYTATVAYELLKEGPESKQKVDSVKIILRAEGVEPTEAKAMLKYNRRKSVITAEIQIPDYDVEAGLRLGLVDGNTKGKGTHSISLDLINNNIPQVSLVTRANLKEMKEGMLQVQLLVPSLKADATITANIKCDDEWELELQSLIKFMEVTSEQKIDLKYDTTRLDVDLKSDVNLKVIQQSEMIEKYGNDFLDMAVGNADMKVRQILKQFVETTNKNLEEYGADLPYLENFRVPDMPEISLPENLFLNVNTKAVYYFNPERFTMVVPLPLGGKSAEELNFPPVLTTPQMSLPQLGLEIVSMEVPIPDFVIPEGFTLTVPYLGKAELSGAMKSNLYNMEASVFAGKDAMEVPNYSAKFNVEGTSPIDILSVKMEGSAMMDITENLKAELKSSLAHKLLEASVSITEDVTITDKISLKSSSNFEVTSPLGLNVAIDHTGMVGLNTEEVSADNNFEGMFKAGPIYGKTLSTQSFIIFPFKPEAKIDSTLQLDSTLLNVQNTIAASLANGEFSIVSNTNAFEDILTQVAEVSFKDNRLSLKCDANVLALGMKIRNQAEASAGVSGVVVRMETNADQTENRVYSLLTASLDDNGLALNSNANLKILENEATHKAALTLNKEGLATSGTTTIQSFLSMENTFSGGLDAEKATLSINNKAAVLDSKIDNANNLIITLSSLEFNSKAEAMASDYVTYTHDITVDLKPYTASANVKNNLKLMAADFINEAQLQAELYKMDLTGSLKAIYGEEEMKHTYQASYADMIANAKCSTTGKVFGTHMNQNTEIEIIGLAARITNDARFNSQPLRFDHSIRCSVVPFDFNLDAIFNGDGDVTMYGKHSGQLYEKFLLRAQPLAFATSHECKASITQELNNGLSLQTVIDNNIETVLSPQRQNFQFEMKSKLNDHLFNQVLVAYNTPEIASIEISEIFLSNIINVESTENQKFAISGFLKYDKSTKSHIIQFPSIENLHAFLDSIKGYVVLVAETLQDYLNNEEIKAKLEALPQYVSDFVAQMNMEDKIIQLKQYFSDLTQDYIISMDDVEASLTNLKETIEKLMADLTVYIQQFAGVMKEAFASGTFPETLLQNAQDMLNAINEEFDIKAMVVYVIDTLKEMISQIDLEKLKGSSIEFLNDIDTIYEIKTKAQTVMDMIRDVIESFDMAAFVAELKNYVSSIDLNAYIQDLVSKIPTEMISEMTASMKEMMQEFDVIGKINSFYAKVRELIVKFEVDQKVQAVLEKTLELLKQFKIEETTTALFKMVQDADIPTKFKQVFQNIINYLNTTEMKDIIQQLNLYLESSLEKLKALDYNAFVDYANQIIADYTIYLNQMIRSLEIAQKLEATREFINMIFSSVKGLMERLREIRVAEIVKSMKDIFDQVVFENLKTFAEYVKEQVTDMDVNALISSYVDFVSKYYTKLMSIITDMSVSIVELIKDVVPEQKLTSEIQQIIDGLLTEIKKAEINMPSFTVPLTDLVVPSITLNLETLKQFEVPMQLDIPEFTICGFYTFPSKTISVNDVKEKIIAFIDFILNLEMEMFSVDTTFGDLTLNYLPTLPEPLLPEINLPYFSFPTLPTMPTEKLVTVPLQLPTLQMLVIPSEIAIPLFGKLSYEIKVNIPIYSIRNAAEIQSSLDVDENPQLSAFLTSQGTSPSFEILNFNLGSTARLGIPQQLNVIAAETFMFKHKFVEVDHEGSVSFADFAAQASAKTTMKATTEMYNAELLNEASLSTKDGLSASLDNSYKHMLNLPGFVNGEASVTQKSLAHIERTTLTITVENQGTAVLNTSPSAHKSDLKITVSPRGVKLALTGDTDTSILKVKQALNADLSLLSYFKMDIYSEAEGPMIKGSLLQGSVNANLYDMNLELKANHNTEVIVPEVDGGLSNVIDFIVSPTEVVLSFKNKANTKVNFIEALTTKIDLQNDYSVTFSADKQQINIVSQARFNQHRLSWNFNVENNEVEVSIFAAAEGKTNIDFLMSPISIPEMNVPFFGFQTPGIGNLDLYIQTGLKDILTTPEQNIDTDFKIVYPKGQSSLITELTFKSAIINVNTNAGLHFEDDLVLRLGTTSTSVLESLNAKLDGTTSLTTQRGIKLANSMSLENRHIEGTHDSTISISTETLEAAASVATVGKIVLPGFSLEASQNLIADTKTKANAVSTMRIKGGFDIPLIKAVGKAEAEHSLKLEGTSGDVSIESSTRANIDGTILEDYLLLGVLDTEANLYMNKDGLRSTSKVIADAKLNCGTDKIFGMDVNENLAIEASLSRVYAVLKYAGNNEVNMFDFFSNGKQIAQATIDIAPASSWIADIEIDMSQPSTLGDFTIFEKTTIDVTASNQKISSNGKFISPLYTTNLVTEWDGFAPISKFLFKSSATSPFVFLTYDLDSSFTINIEDGGLIVTEKMVFSNTELTMDLQHVLSHTLSGSHLTLNVDITSPAFTDMNLRYAVRKDGISTTISIPSVGFLGFQLQARASSQMNTRLYGRLASEPGKDIDILMIKVSNKDTNKKINLKMVFNMEAPDVMLNVLVEKLPAITSCLSVAAERYQLISYGTQLKRMIVDSVEEAHNFVNSDVPLSSQVSILFRSTVVQFQRTAQVFLDAAIKVLRETMVKLPGSDEMIPLAEVLNRINTRFTLLVEGTVDLVAVNAEYAYRVVVDKLSEIEVTMPVGDVMAGAKIIKHIKESIKALVNAFVDALKQMESVDVSLEKIGDTMKFLVDKAQEFVDKSPKSDILEGIAVYINSFYAKQMKTLKAVTWYVDNVTNIETLNETIDLFLKLVKSTMEDFIAFATNYLEQAPVQYKSYLKVEGNKLEVNI